MQLPTEILDYITTISNDILVAYTLKNYITKYTFDKIEKNVLIYGNIQGGKTAEIIKIIKEKTDYPKVLVVQNSLMVLKQYMQRFKTSNIKYHVVEKGISPNHTPQVYLIMSNKFRYSSFTTLNIDKYILILDESDQTFRNCKLINNAHKIYHVTATPFGYTKQFDRIQVLDKHKDYNSIEDLTIVEEFDPVNVILEMKSTNTPTMLLINKYRYVSEMSECASKLSIQFPEIPIVFLSQLKLYLNNKITFTKKSISKIIDSLQNYPQIIFIANRHSLRGLSYTSSDYTRHLTHQITFVRSDLTNFVQSLRILGIYSGIQHLKLYVDDLKLYQKTKKQLDSFNVKHLR